MRKCEICKEDFASGGFLILGNEPSAVGGLTLLILNSTGVHQDFSAEVELCGQQCAMRWLSDALGRMQGVRPVFPVEGPVERPKVFTRYCAWCRTFLSGDPEVPYDAPGVSHGTCKDCLEKERARMKAERGAA